MEPTLVDGCSILVNQASQRRRVGRIFVVRTEEGLVVKRARKDRAGDRRGQVGRADVRVRSDRMSPGVTESTTPARALARWQGATYTKTARGGTTLTLCLSDNSHLCLVSTCQ